MITAWNEGAIVARMTQARNRGVVRAIGIVEQRAVTLITTGERSGIIYRRRGIEHQASAPGEPPASDSGRLAAAREIKLDVGTGRAVLYFHTLYAWYLEAGTIKMEPRPFALRSLYETKADTLAAIAEEFRVEFRAAA